ncbi:hypothetical protein [Limosilactobacillus sp.]|uniref:hypothetical protein n=1 Tax=Limosilactobacillus sp. TaxID=2773925 RepID=UPI003F734006
MQSAASEAQSGAAQALSDAQTAIKNVASDAQTIRQHIADVESEVSADQQANSSAAQQLRDDLSTAKQSIATANDNLTKAQSAIDDTKKAIASNAAAIQSAVAQHKKDITAAQAANAQTASELASYTKQAQEQGKTIADLQKGQDSVTSTIADIKGNVTQVQQSVTTLQGALKDTNGNVDVVKAQADSLQSTLTDYQKNVASLSATAKSLTASMKDAQERLSTVEQTASEQSTTISDLQGDFTQVKQEADKLTTTLKDAQGDIAQTQATAKSLSTQIESAQGDIASLQTTATSLNASFSDHSKRIASIEARADKLESDMKDAQGNITAVTQTASAAGVAASDAKSNAAMAIVTASGAVAAAKDAQGDAAEAKVTASGASVVASDAKSDVISVQTTASEAKLIATNASSQAMKATATASGMTITISGVESTANDAASQASAAGVAAKNAQTSADKAGTAAGNAQSTANAAQNTANQANSVASKAQATADNNAKSITTVQANVTATQKELSGKVDESTLDATNQRLDNVSAQLKVTAGEVSSKAEQTTVTGLTNIVNNIKDATGWKTVTGAFDANNYKTTQQIFYRDTQAKNAPDPGWFFFTVDAPNADRITQTVIKDNTGVTWTRLWNSTAWTSWVKQATANDVNNVQAQVIKQSTEISNNTKLINLAAKQTTVDTITNEVKQQQAQQKIFTDQIQSKVTSSDVKGMLADGKYATQSYTQTLVNQAADTWNLNITELRNKANADHQSDITRMTNLQASIDGLQGVVKNKADLSKVTQLADTYQVKLTGNLLANLDKKAQKYTVGVNTFFTFAPVDVTKVTKGTVLTLSFDYTSDADCTFVPQLDGAPWIPWGDIKSAPVAVKANVPGHYVKQITVADDSWTKGTAKNIAIRIDNFGGTFTVSNLTLRSGDNVASTFDMLQYDMDLRVQKGDLLSQINIEAGRTLLQSKKIFMDADTVVMGPNTKAFIPSAAIINLDVAKLNAGTVNTDRIHIGDNSVYLSVKNNFLRLDGSNTKAKYQLRLTGNDIEFADSGSSNWAYRIQHGITKYQTDEDGLDFDVSNKRGGANHTVMSVSDAGVMISPSLFFQTNGIDSPNWMGFTRNTEDGNTSVSFHTWNDENEGFHVDCGARFLNYVYINGYARAQGWLTNSTLSKKTNIHKLDNQVALDKIRQDDQYLYEYKRNVAKGIYDPQASFIIDDVNNVSQYSVPREFIDQTGNYREPNVELAYLVAAFQALDKQVQQQQELIKKLEAKLNAES